METQGDLFFFTLKPVWKGWKSDPYEDPRVILRDAWILYMLVGIFLGGTSWSMIYIYPRLPNTLGLEVWLDPKNIPKAPSQEVLGRLGIWSQFWLKLKQFCLFNCIGDYTSTTY